MIHPTFCSLMSRLRNAQHIPKAILEQRNPKHKPPFPLTHSYQIQSGPSASKRVRSYWGFHGLSSSYNMLIQRQLGGGGGGGGRSGGGYPILLRPCVRRTALIEGWMDGFSSWKNEISQQHQSIDINSSLQPSLPPSTRVPFSLSPKMSISTPLKCGH